MDLEEFIKKNHISFRAEEGKYMKEKPEWDARLIVFNYTFQVEPEFEEQKHWLGSIEGTYDSENLFDVKTEGFKDIAPDLVKKLEVIYGLSGGEIDIYDGKLKSPTFQPLYKASDNAFTERIFIAAACEPINLDLFDKKKN